MAGEEGGRDPYRQARIAAAMALIALVLVRGLLDIFIPGFDVQDVYGALLLGAALGLLGIAHWDR